MNPFGVHDTTLGPPSFPSFPPMSYSLERRHPNVPLCYACMRTHVLPSVPEMEGMVICDILY